MLRFAQEAHRGTRVQFFLDGWFSVTDDPAVYESLEETLNADAPLRMRIPMLYAEGVRR